MKKGIRMADWEVAVVRKTRGKEMEEIELNRK